MTAATADLATAIATVWNASTLDASFKALWNASVDPDDFPVLHEQEAGGEQPWPYCIVEMSPGATIDRMSDDASGIREIRDVPVEFRVYAMDVDGDARSAKQIAAHLIEEILKVFGGHPTQAPTGLAPVNGNHLITSYQNDFPVRHDEDHYAWHVGFNFRLDVPVKTM